MVIVLLHVLYLCLSRETPWQACAISFCSFPATCNVLSCVFQTFIFTQIFEFMFQVHIMITTQPRVHDMLPACLYAGSISSVIDMLPAYRPAGSMSILIDMLPAYKHAGSMSILIDMLPAYRHACSMCSLIDMLLYILPVFLCGRISPTFNSPQKQFN